MVAVLFDPGRSLPYCRTITKITIILGRHSVSMCGINMVVEHFVISWTDFCAMTGSFLSFAPVSAHTCLFPLGFRVTSCLNATNLVVVHHSKQLHCDIDHDQRACIFEYLATDNAADYLQDLRIECLIDFMSES